MSPTAERSTAGSWTLFFIAMATLIVIQSLLVWQNQPLLVVSLGIVGLVVWAFWLYHLATTDQEIKTKHNVLVDR